MIDPLAPLTIISAVNLRRFDGDFTEIYMDVWFEEITGPVPFNASPFYDYRYGKELWFMAMAGHFGPIEVMPLPDLPALPPAPKLLAYNKEPAQ